jgi:hypothetical protein
VLSVYRYRGFRLARPDIVSSRVSQLGGSFEMLSVTHSSRFAATCAVVATASMASMVSTSAFAAALPMALTVTADLRPRIESLNPNSVSGGIGIYNGTLSSADNWNAYYNFNASSSVSGASASAYQTGSFSLTNLTSGTVTYLIALALPTEVVGAQVGTYTFNGSVSGTLITSGGPGMLQTVGAETSLWTAQTGGSVVDTLFDDPFMVQRSSAGATNFGSQSFSGMNSSTFGDTIGMTFSFRLSAGSTASFTTSLNGSGTIIPAPGALALLGCAGLVGNRRRRR